MILYGTQRKGGKNLALHLERGDTNEHVTVHDVRGFISEDMVEAFQEAEALSRLTRCEQFLFSLSLNPPEEEETTIDDFEDAIDKVEKALGLAEQPRVIVFHEKNGRRHCHCVWSRIYHDGEKFKALNMAFYKMKLNAVSLGLYLHHGWKIPPGFFKGKGKETNYALGEWQQAERLKENPEKLKGFFQNCWKQSDSKQSFGAALQEMGYYLARGDRRGFVAVDYQGEVYSLSRWTGVKTKELKQKLGNPQDLPHIDIARQHAESRMDSGLKQILAEKRVMFREQRKPLVQELRQMVIHQRKQRNDLIAEQNERAVREAKARAKRLPTGLSAIWAKVTGRYAEIAAELAKETENCRKRDRAEMEKLVKTHLSESRDLHKTLNFYKDEQQNAEWQLKRRMAGYINTATAPPQPEKKEETAKELQSRLQELESKITALSGDIASLQAAMASTHISDEMRGRIRQLLDRAKEMALFQQAKKKQEQQQKAEKQKAEELIQLQQQLYQILKQHEELKQKQAEQKRQIAANTAFYERIQNMQYDLNGLPLYPMRVLAPPGEAFNIKEYRETLKRESNQNLVNTVKTKPPKKQIVSTTGLSQSALTAQEALRRAGKPPRRRTGQRKPAANLKNVKLAAQFSP
ncbi:MAG: hypothetical protein EA357_04225 [Micavibrio sp.]|nr:MAG: hypothetical protein EA357_04225 [Micavibrio sp.]